MNYDEIWAQIVYRVNITFENIIGITYIMLIYMITYL